MILRCSILFDLLWLVSGKKMVCEKNKIRNASKTNKLKTRFHCDFVTMIAMEHWRCLRFSSRIGVAIENLHAFYQSFPLHQSLKKRLEICP